MKYAELIGTGFLIGSNAECVVTEAKLIDQRYLLCEVTIPMFNNWKVSTLIDLMTDPMDTNDLTSDDITFIKEALTDTYNEGT